MYFEKVHFERNLLQWVCSCVVHTSSAFSKRYLIEPEASFAMLYLPLYIPFYESRPRKYTELYTLNREGRGDINVIQINSLRIRSHSAPTDNLSVPPKFTLIRDASCALRCQCRLTSAGKIEACASGFRDFELQASRRESFLLYFSLAIAVPGEQRDHMRTIHPFDDSSTSFKNRRCHGRSCRRHVRANKHSFALPCSLFDFQFHCPDFKARRAIQSRSLFFPCLLTVHTSY